MGEFGFSGHICLTYLTTPELLQSVRPYIVAGIMAKEKIVYVADESWHQEIKDTMLGWDKMMFEQAFSSQQVVIVRTGDLYYPSGVFDPEVTMQIIAQMEKEALEQGYLGMWGVGEMDWMFDDVVGIEKVYEYEKKLTEWIKDQKVSVICAYNKARFGPEMINLMLRLHHCQLGKGHQYQKTLSK